MGLGNRSNNVTYLKVKDGKFYVNGQDTPYDELEGLITKIYFKDEEYEGATLRKCVFILNSDSIDYQLTLNVESGNFSSIVSFLHSADLSKKLTLHPKLTTENKEGKEVKRYAILVSQNGKFSKSYFNQETNVKLGVPQWKTITAGKKKITDKSEYSEFLENFVLDNYATKLSIAEPIEAKQGLKQSVKEENPLDTDTSDDKLPWE